MKKDEEITVVEAVKPDYESEIIKIIKGNYSPRAAQNKLEGYHGNDVAGAMDALSVSERKKLYRICTAEMLAETFEHLDEDEAGAYLDEMDIQKAAAVVSNLEADTATYILREIERQKRVLIIDALPMDIRKDIADLKEQRHVIARLRKRGFLDEKKYNEKLIEIESKMAKLDRELKKHTKTDSEDETLEHLDVLIDCFECQSSIMSGFNEELFGMIVEKVIVRNNMLEFSLISGIVFKEKI